MQKSVSFQTYLRGHVVRRSAEGVGHPVQVDLELAHSEIREPDVTLVIKKNVVQL